MEENKEEKKEILRFLKQNGIDTRFTSVILPYIYINNLRFSKFSRKKEEIFQKNYPHIKVVRSNIFQKICSRSSKILGDVLQPREKVLIPRPSSPWEQILPIILEPYTRKYGIEIIEKELDFKQIYRLSVIDFDVIALPQTLDHEVEHILGQIFSGEKIGLKNSETKISSEKGIKRDIKLIYPLINVPMEWICYYLNLEEADCKINSDKENIHDFLLFLETVVPQVRENIFKSSVFLSEEEKID